MQQVLGSAFSSLDAAAEAPAVPAKALGWARRYTIVALVFVAFMLCNMDRVNMSIAILPMRDQFGWSPQTLSLIHI